MQRNAYEFGAPYGLTQTHANFHAVRMKKKNSFTPATFFWRTTLTKTPKINLILIKNQLIYINKRFVWILVITKINTTMIVINVSFSRLFVSEPHKTTATEPRLLLRCF